MTPQQLDNLKAILHNIQQQSQEVYRIAFRGEYEDLDWVQNNLYDTALELENFIGEFEEEVPCITNATTQVVREAMKIVSKDVTLPKAVREGIVKEKKQTKEINNGNDHKY